MKCNCGKIYRQVEYDGNLPKFCQDCGAKLNGDDENFLGISYSDDHDVNRMFIFVKGRLKGKTVDFRFDLRTYEIVKFPKNDADLAELSFLKTFLIHYADGRIKIFGDPMR